MGKWKTASSRFQLQCATKSLHEDPSNVAQRLVHSSKIPAAVKEDLFRQLGRSSKGFKGYICVECIHRVSPYSPAQYEEESTVPSVSDHMLSSRENSEHSQACSSTCDADVNTDVAYVLSVANLRNDVRALPLELRSMVAFELALAEKSNIRTDALALTKGNCRDLNVLTSLCEQSYLDSKNDVLVSFLTGLMNITSTKSASGYLPFPIEKPSDIYQIAKVTEACMGLTTPITVLPFHFRELVLLYSLTRSRMALTLLSSTAPHGSYQTVRGWLDKQATCDDGAKLNTRTGDHLCVFDNNQVLQRRWKISVNNTSTCSIITMVIFMDIEPEGTLQYQERFKPTHWMWTNLSPEKLELARQGHLNPTYQTTRYKKHFHPWLTNIIEQVAEEQRVEDGKCEDEIDTLVSSQKHSEEFKTCTMCGFENVPKRKRICPTCNKKMPSSKAKCSTSTDKGTANKKSSDGAIRVVVTRREDSTYEMKYQQTSHPTSDYDHLPQRHPKEPPRISIGEPIFLNPCSYEAVAEVFREIGKQAGIKKYGGTKEWISIVCDGLPYVLGYQLIEQRFICTICDAHLSGKAECSTHRTTHETGCTYEQEFGWILLQPGPGHIEMNMLKTFVKFAWPVFWEKMVELFNFRSEIAKKSALSVSDHHKGMTLARIARESFAKELVLPYVRHELEKEACTLSVAGFFKYSMTTVKSPIYAFISDLVFVILDAIFLYRAGLRSGDPEMMDAGRAYFCRMWSARSHPLYRQLAAYDTITSVCMPPAVHEFTQKTKSFNLSGVAYSGEGADFKLEEVNRGVQHWIPSAPTNKDWINACANYTKLARLRQATLTEMDLKDPKERTFRGSSTINEQVLAFRVAIRESQYLSHHDQTEPLVSLGKEPLDEDLINFATTAYEKEKIYFDTFVQHMQHGNTARSSIPFAEPPVFVTPEERTSFNEIKNKTISECVTLINLKINEIEDVEMRNNFSEAFEQEVIYKRGKKPVKQDYINFYDLLQEFESTLDREVQMNNVDDV